MRSTLILDHSLTLLPQAKLVFKGRLARLFKFTEEDTANMSKYSTAATILLSIVSLAAANADSVLSEIDATNKAFAKAILAGDIDRLVNDYTDDGCVIAPKAPETCGKESIRGFWEAVIASNPKNVEIITQKAGSEGNLAYATGELIITDAEAAVHKSRFALVFKRVQSLWKLRVDSWTPQ